MSGLRFLMPLLVLNMGGEMMYILQQRLTAQNIATDKAGKVLHDIVKTMLNEKFVGELFKPQDMYSSSATKQIFARLAHSSIMRLSGPSMDKLYDLMLMGFKMQWINCHYPQEVLQVTFNHLRTLQQILGGDGECRKLVDSVIEKTEKCYKKMTHSDFLLIDLMLGQFFQSKRIKVSLFLQSGIQKPDGNFVLNRSGPVAYGAEVPGTVRYYSSSGSVSRTSKFTIKSSTLFTESDQPRAVTLGENLYIKSQASASQAAGSKSVPEDKSAAAKPAQEQDKAPAKSAADVSKSVKAELNMLADLLGPHPDSEDKESRIPNMKISLFAADPFDLESEEKYEPHVDTIVFDAAKDHKSVTNMMKDFGLDEDRKGSQEDKDARKGDDDDLLALMDSAK